MNNPSPSPRREARIRYQSMTLMAIAITFALLLLVIAVLLCTMLIKDDSDHTGDLPQDPPSGDTTPGDGTGTTPPTGNEGNDPTGGTENPPAPPRSEIRTSDQIHTGNLILVNKTHKYEFPLNGGNLINVYNEQEAAGTRGQYFQLPGSKLYMEQNAYFQMNKWLKEFNDSSLHLVGAYRTYEMQESLNSSIPAGYSDSHTGLSCELRTQNQAGHPVKISPETHRALYDNAYKYGFIVRYPADKNTLTEVPNYTYYFRYVGYVHAYLINTNNFCLEEYILYLQRYTYGENSLKVTTPDGSNYEIYYVKASGTQQTIIPLPAEGSYTISGDNEGGFIVTVKAS